MELLTILFYILFVLAAIVLIVVILLQEGRGGGFGEALGSGGRETFGVGSRGINTFTAVTAGIFLGSALLIHILNRGSATRSVLDETGGAPVVEGTVEQPAGGPAPEAPENP